jgi:hypothetical protein
MSINFLYRFYMTKNILLFFKIRKYFIYLLLWAPSAITIALTLESLYFLSVHFNEIFLIPDWYVLELLFFTLMLPISHWYKRRWTTLSVIHKRIFLIIATLGAIDLLMYLFVFGYLSIEFFINYFIS